MSGDFRKLMLGALLSLVLAACGTTAPSRFYLLTIVHDDSAGVNATRLQKNAYLGIGPIKFPEYLNRSQIVTRGPGAEVYIADAQRWAEPLHENFMRVVSENLSASLQTQRIAIHPWRNWHDIDYQITIDVIRFDATTEGDVLLIAHWKINGQAGRQQLWAEKSTIRVKSSSADYADIVLAHSTAVGQLCQEIAEKLGQLPSQGSQE